MATTVWKGHLTFGLVSIPIRLFRAARREKIRFQQLYRPEPSAAREVDVEPEPDEESPSAEPTVFPTQHGSFATGGEQAPIPASQLVKGYEFAKGRFVTIEKDEIEKIAAKTSTGMDIFEFVKFDEIDPVYLDASYYVAPEEAGEKPYALLFDAMRESGYVALAEFAMRRRQRAVVIRPGQSGILAHTLYYADEIRKQDERAADSSNVQPKEKALALTLVQAMAATFEPEKLKDTYRQDLMKLIAAKTAGRQAVAIEAESAKAPVVDIMEALQKSLAARRKPVASEAPARKIKRKNQR